MDFPPKTDIWARCLEYAALSDVGLRRSNNQDSLAVVLAPDQASWNRRGHLFMVADGMGAHAAGELASKIAVDTLPLTYQKSHDASVADALHDAVVAANNQIHQRGEASEDFRGMGTTASTLVLTSAGAIVAHVGDSRVYRLRGQKLEQLTFDHSLVWEMSAAGRMPEDDVPDFVPRNIITRSLGPNAEVQIDLEGPFPLEAGDTFLLCSDGLSGPVQDEELGTIIGCLTPDDAAKALVDLANLRGGPDNITVIVVRVTGPQVADTPNGQTPPTKPRPREPIPPIQWALLAGFAMAAVGAALMQRWIAAGVGLIGTAVMSVVMMASRQSPSDVQHALPGRPLGKGPHRTRNCTPNGEFVDRLSRMVQQLADAATNEDWQINWHQFNTMRSEADAATFAANYSLAVRLYCQALTFMMTQLRHQHE
ncbi:MAG: serine/threonine-protein phosphatase [Pirellulales bacterium]|nr:serine/threonine-protein phosphatase [Pirellulales bacterium]